MSSSLLLCRPTASATCSHFPPPAPPTHPSYLPPNMPGFTKLDLDFICTFTEVFGVGCASVCVVGPVSVGV